MKSWPQFNNKMIDSVKELLESGKVNQWTSNAVSEFEKKICRIY